MRVTHHFDREGAQTNPSRVVTELFGAAGRRALDNMLLRGAPMMVRKLYTILNYCTSPLHKLYLKITIINMPYPT